MLDSRGRNPGITGAQEAPQALGMSHDLGPPVGRGLVGQQNHHSFNQDLQAVTPGNAPSRSLSAVAQLGAGLESNGQWAWSEYIRIPLQLWLVLTIESTCQIGIEQNQAHRTGTLG